MRKPRTTMVQRGRRGTKVNRISTKRTGEIVEMAFMQKAATLGFGVAKPFGDSERYDFILDGGRRFVRVQVKSSSHARHRSYTVNAYWHTIRKHMPYMPSQVDFVVVLILGHDIWYVIPTRALAGRMTIRLYPFGGHRKGSRRHEKYRDAWHLLLRKR